MARPKPTKANSIEKTIATKIESIQSDIKALQDQLKHWQKVASDYETNKVTIESILSVHDAPDLGGSTGTRGGRGTKKSGGGGNG